MLSFILLSFGGCQDNFKGTIKPESSPLLSFSQTDYVFQKDDAIQIQANIRGTVVNCEVEPALPFGLYLNSQNCSISGIGLIEIPKTYFIVSFKNEYGESIPRQLSLTITSHQSTPAIAMGTNHSCALKSSGEVYCVGDNSVGQLGDGTNTSSLTPVKVFDLEDVIKISSFTDFTCALLRDKTVKCWGKNDRAQLGDASAFDRNSPVVALGVSGVVDVKVGAAHTCVLLEDESVRCWGYNANGELGQGVTSSSIVLPVTPIGFSSGVASLSVGAFQSCAVFHNGTAKCTGYNHQGQTGVGYTGTVSTPGFIQGLPAGIKNLVLGREHACASLSNDEVYCWGEGNAGQLGNGTTTPSVTPVKVTGLNGITAMSSGRNTICALNTYGIVKCWGANYYGKVGVGDTVNRTTASQISIVIGVKTLVSGYEGSCAVKEDLETHCWGLNDHGQLGDGTMTTHYAPVLIPNIFAE